MKQSGARGTARYIVDQIERFDQKNEMFKRPLWDTELMEIGRSFYGVQYPREERPGYDFVSQAFKNASYYLDLCFAHGMFGGRWGLYAWESKPWGENPQPKGMQFNAENSQSMSQIIKKAALFYGASLVGMTHLDERWFYSHHYYPKPSGFSETIQPVQIPEDHSSVIVLAYAGDYEVYQHSPDFLSGAEVGKGYSKMAFTAGLLSQFIRLLGYQAFPFGNDTALSIPLAIDAGLGELGRNGLLITPEYGPRVRLNKIVTNLPLAKDTPIDFGVWDFCAQCEKCARLCPSQAIPRGKATTKVHDISNLKGLIRWPVDAKRCFSFWAKNGTACSNCIRSCPFNKPSNSLHTTVRYAIRHMPRLNPLWMWADDALGYGKKKKSHDFWG